METRNPRGRENEIVLRVRGGMQIECVNTLKELIKPENAKIVLDLSDVTLADRDAAMFLAVCELKGVELRNCRCGRRARHPRIALKRACTFVIVALLIAIFGVASIVTTPTDTRAQTR
jgi:anti-anti-sigma regulatory factor